jgi:hypothetical protein
MDRNARRGGLERPERGKYQLWPVIKKPLPPSTPGLPSVGGERSLAMSISSPSLGEANLPNSRRPPLKAKIKDGSLTGRRNRSIPELGLGPMTTVQESFLDSRKFP